MVNKYAPFPLQLAEAINLKQVMQVTGVTLVETKLNKIGVIVNAEGLTKTVAWRFIELRPRSSEPQNGIHEFDLIGDGSEAILDAIGSVEASFAYPEKPAGFRGVAVHSETAVITRLL